MIKHNFVSGKLDGTDATLVQASAWDAVHDWTPLTTDDDIPIGQLAAVLTGVAPNRILALRYRVDASTVWTLAERVE